MTEPTATKPKLSTAQKRKIETLAGIAADPLTLEVSLFDHHQNSHKVIALYAKVRKAHSTIANHEYSYTKLVIYHKVPDVADEGFEAARRVFNAKAKLARDLLETRKQEMVGVEVAQ